MLGPGGFCREVKVIGLRVGAPTSERV